MAGMDAGMETLKRERERLRNVVGSAKSRAERLDQVLAETRAEIAGSEAELAEVEDSIRKLIGAR